jgi:hypothetical protein
VNLVEAIQSDLGELVGLLLQIDFIGVSVVVVYLMLKRGMYVLGLLYCM